MSRWVDGCIDDCLIHCCVFLFFNRYYTWELFKEWMSDGRHEIRRVDKQERFSSSSQDYIKESIPETKPRVRGFHFRV